ncbi:MAG: DUF1802 family protein [Leptolyngbyaceae cyanobacterium SM2_3_12]|nr:DUF1802 family protein [Leptolyngbyaceae cyanobacterium SM2_3_12]
MVIDWALKEWDAAVTALGQGQTVLLLRKGGIREQAGQFSVRGPTGIALAHGGTPKG